MDKRLKQLCKMAMIAAMTAVLAQVVLPIGPVPFNLAVLGAFFAGIFLSPAYAAFCMFAYMFMGLVGLPVFAGLKGGFGVLAGPTGGYIVGYVAIAILTSLGKNKKVWIAALLMTAGVAACYVLGTAWFMIVSGSNLATSLAYCVVPFILPDLAKGVVAYVVGKAVNLRLAFHGD